jgi:anti-sigma regulatory factor (Ser/Thr protein kinase)
MPTVELRFTPVPAHVRTARLVAAVLARRAGVAEELIDEVKLAVGEACARAVGLHQEHAGAEEVVVSLADDDHRFAVAVRDRGPHGSGTVEDLPDAPELGGLVEELAERDAAPALPPGFGLAVVAGLVEDVVITQAEPGTVVRMTWPAGAVPA